ncbi:hypothetical protein DBR32_13495 [Taibaiella sp. KBW10]|uniref:DUF4271 domain-containing protein n=1 Tax=Taibaiella sp. KBW10 TaxID=2153357 RepID=UPI000F598DFE|nr:DUF4271 domain-containing protein [Taibaiella sp. KBW10]RQO30566.1 hypothetical protein DBR32_13495 [Taibaiella sp. KBW10]
MTELYWIKIILLYLYKPFTFSKLQFKNQHTYIIVFFLTILSLFLAGTTDAKELYGYNIPEALIKVKADSAFSAHFATHPMMGKAVKVISQVEKPHTFVNKTSSFYLVLLLLFVLGSLRLIFPTYFRHLYNAFTSPLMNKRQLREQIEQNIQANIAMNIFFSISIGFFLYALLFTQTTIVQHASYSPNLILCGLILLVAAVYTVKYLLLKFVGWVFKIASVTEAYTYNVFLINKILAVVLLPFSIILAFGHGGWLRLMLAIALILTGILLINRYTRSWSSLGSFFQYSKFHFFMYFCASELLPLAILVKLTFNTLV